MFVCLYVMSSKHNVVSGSYFCVCDEQYSEERRKPKKAVVTAAQSMHLSACDRDDAARYVKMTFNLFKVTGMRFGAFLACRLIALTSMYNLGR